MKLPKSIFTWGGRELCALIAVASIPVAALADGAYTWSHKNITVTGEATLGVTNAEMQVDVAAGGSATLEIAQSVYVRAQEGGSVSFAVSDDSNAWTNKVALWLDASEEWSLLPETNRLGQAQKVGNSYAIFKWLDKRDNNPDVPWSGWRGYNSRGLANLPGSITQTSVMPYVVSNGCNGLTYVTMGQLAAYGRRMPFVPVVDGEEQIPSNPGDFPSTTIPASYVIMVFGSQNGGGQAVMSGLSRASVGDSVAAGVGIFTNDLTTTTRLDGLGVDPVNTGLNGGWQVLSFVPKANTVKGIGWLWTNKRCGGQNVAEVLVFTNTLSALDIAKAEKYLAEKWGVSSYNGVYGVRLFGGGTASVPGGKVMLGGEFSGTLDVARGATVELTDSRLAPTNPATGMTGWYDPCRADKTTTSGSTSPKDHRIETLKNLSGVTIDGMAYNLCGGGRSPYFFDEARGWGPERRWYDYRKSLSGSDGNAMRFNNSWESEGQTLPVRTGFMILDTSKGGGNPFFDTSLYHYKMTNMVRRTAASDPIFIAMDGEDSAFVTNSPAYLDGQGVEARFHTFNYRPELLSFSFTGSLPLKCFGDFTQSGDNFELRHGEIVLYPDALADDARRDTEAYLMKKWLGITPPGYGDASLMTVAGAGTVKTAAGAPRPKVADGFTGTLDVAGGSIAFKIDSSAGEPVTDAIDVPDGTLATEGTLSVDVSFAGQSVPGKYTLVSAGSWNATQEIVLGTASGDIDTRKMLLLLSRTGNTLVLEVWPRGTMVIIR